MSDRFQEKFRISSARLRNWDYGWNGIYFITICTAGHDPFFGVAENNKMVLSEIGLTAQSLWLEIPVHFDYIQLNTFVIMPNHIHGIIIIQKPEDSNNILNRTQKCRNLPNDEIIVETGITVETRLIASLQNHLTVPSTNSFIRLRCVSCASLIRQQIF